MKLIFTLTSQTSTIPKQEKRQKIDQHVENTHPRDEVPPPMNISQHTNFEPMYPKTIIITIRRRLSSLFIPKHVHINPD